MSFNLFEANRDTRTYVDKSYVVFLSLLHIGAVAAFFMFSWSNVAAFFIFYLISGVGITIGYHRLLTHKSFTVPKAVEYLFAICGNFAMEGSPVLWVAQHRQHHKESDRDLDPHNIKVGFIYAHIGWIFLRYPAWYEQGQKDTFAKDIQKDKFYMWIDKYHYFFPMGLGAVLLLMGGPGMFLWGFCLRLVAMYHSTWFVNSAAHAWGYRPFKEEIATNNWWVAILSLGEGWHNNHHKFPTSARHGLRGWEFDLSWIVIWTMKTLGIARKVKVPAAEELPWKNKRVANSSFSAET